MTVYLDYLFIENFIFDLILITQTKFLSKLSLKIGRAIAACFISSMYVCILIVTKQSQLNCAFSKILLSFVIVYIAFKPNSISKYMKTTAVFYISSILTLGVSIMVSKLLCDGEKQNLVTKMVVYILVTFITYVVTQQFWKIYKFNIKSKNLNIPVEIMLSGKKYTYTGFLDTGNTVYSYELGVPIVFAEYISDEQKKDIKNLECTDIMVSTISKKTSEKAILVKGKIHEKEVKFGVIFVENRLNKNREYNMILNYQMFEENLGGISV